MAKVTQDLKPRATGLFLEFIGEQILNPLQKVVEKANQHTAYVEQQNKQVMDFAAVTDNSIKVLNDYIYGTGNISKGVAKQTIKELSARFKKLEHGYNKIAKEARGKK